MHIILCVLMIQVHAYKSSSKYVHALTVTLEKQSKVDMNI